MSLRFQLEQKKLRRQTSSLSLEVDVKGFNEAQREILDSNSEFMNVLGPRMWREMNFDWTG